jgi:DNA-binding PadR family transcriptional regulator
MEMKMLSKVSVLILGIIDEKPLNPYEITKILEMIHVKDWFSVAVSSVYSTIKKLSQKSYISGEIVREGNMPEKTIYTVTKKGKKILSETLIYFLMDTELDPLKFNIACIMLCHLKKDEALNVLNKRLLMLKRHEKEIKEHYNLVKGNKLIPYTGLTVIRQNIYLVQAEIRISSELIAEVQKDKSWNHFIAINLK